MNISSRTFFGLVVGAVSGSLFIAGCGATAQTAADPTVLPATVSNLQNEDFELVALPTEVPGKWNFAMRPRRPIASPPIFEWDFGDGQRFLGPEQTHTFAEAGAHLVTVRALDNTGIVLFVLTLEVNVPAVNRTPLANAGPNTSALANELVFLDGGASTDPDGDVLNYNWKQISGPPVFLLNANSAIASFVTPITQNGTRLVFTLEVGDGTLSAQANAIVDVQAPSDPGQFPSMCAFDLTVAGDTAVSPELDGQRPLSVGATVTSADGQPLTEGTVTWMVDGATEAGTLSTHTTISRVFTSAGRHTLSVSLLVGGITVGCSTIDTGAPEGKVDVWPIIAGRVHDGAGGPLSGVTVSANAGGTTSVSDSAGTYTISVPFSWSGTVTAQHADHTFVEPSRDYTNVQADLADEPFVAPTAQVSCISDVSCDDGVFCNGTETCISNSCVSAGNPCSAGETCIEATNICQAGPTVSALLSEDFNAYAAGADPPNWFDTGSANSLLEDPTLFSVLNSGGDNVFGTSSGATNIHAHYNGTGSDGWSGYTFTGSMMITDAGAGIGVTFLSDYPTSNVYYRLRRHAGAAALHISPHGTSIAGGITDTGVVPQANTWYRFTIDVDDTASRTNLRAKVWAQGSAEPSAWQVDCFDDSPTRLTTGTVGVWSMGPGEKHWDNFTVHLQNCDMDADADGVVDCNDGCPTDPAKTAPGICGCGAPDTGDSDGDSVLDCVDQCPGGADTDSDGDGVPDCIDQCPGAPDLDSDADGVMDCSDGCPNDANKTAAGACGCGVSDLDSDADGTLDCNDGCPDDRRKAQPGVCGCNRPDVDENGSPVLDPADCPVGQTTRSITQYGITWTFDRDHEFGQFVNGDYWVVGPVAIHSISPGWDGERHGSMINPAPGWPHGYHTKVFSYEPALNVAIGVSSTNPLIVPSGSSLVSTVGCSEGEPCATDVRVSMPGAPLPSLVTAAVLTVLPTQPPNSGTTVFRPPYTNTTKLLYSSQNLHIELFPRLPFVPSRPSILPNISSLATSFRRVWLDHKYNWPGRYLHPSQNMPNYGRDMARSENDGFLSLLLDYSDSEKRDLSIGLIQIGIDNYGVLKSARDNNLVEFGLFGGGAGQGSGRKLPILFAGVMLDKPELIQEMNAAGSLPFQEDCQTFYASQDDVNRYPALFPTVGAVYWGTEHCSNPGKDNRDLGYRSCCSSNVWNGAVLFSIVMSDSRGISFRDLWDHVELFDYEDHYMDPSFPGSPAVGSWTRSFSDFAEEMWDTYRHNYP